VVAEAYRSLRTRVIAAAAARCARTLLITSPAWENRSTIAANLAVALAQSGRRTVLVCADLRWGRADGLLGVPGDEGFTMLLDRRISLATALQPTGTSGLKVLPPGRLPRDPAGYLQRPALRTVVGELRSHADFVIIEAPPLLAASDTAPLMALAEMILLVADARKSTRAHLWAVMRDIEEAADKLIGCVLCNVGRRRWLHQPRVRPVAVVSPDPDAWSWTWGVDGQEAVPAQAPTKKVSMPGGPSKM
jgi:capsular exopolysaccharide synthesis family protein